jgi:molybdopterin/thiamine biosynthesis adenylyltransferase
MNQEVIRITDPETDENDRFSRFNLISWWEQANLQAAKILVIGAGALGNEILKNLSLLGVGNIFVADMDIIENSNLSRSILFRAADNGLGKAEVAARSVKNIYPEINVQWFQGNILFDLGLGVYDWADVVIAGLDNREARWFVNKCCWKTGTPWIDGAIEQLNGVVRVFVPPHGACYECTMGETDWEILQARRGCQLLTRDEMLQGRVPTTPTSASIIAGIQCQEAVKLLHGLEVLESKGFIFNGLTHDSYIIQYPLKEDCTSHESFSPIRKLNRSVTNTSLKELLTEIQNELGDDAILEFNHDIIESLECYNCGNVEQLLKSAGKVKEKEGKCPICGNTRLEKSTHFVEGSEDFLDKTFENIGIPPYDIIVGRKNKEQIFLQFDQDAPSVLGSLYKTR